MRKLYTFRKHKRGVYKPDKKLYEIVFIGVAFKIWVISAGITTYRTYISSLILKVSFLEKPCPVNENVKVMQRKIKTISGVEGFAGNKASRIESVFPNLPSKEHSNLFEYFTFFLLKVLITAFQGFIENLISWNYLSIDNIHILTFKICSLSKCLKLGNKI